MHEERIGRIVTYIDYRKILGCGRVSCEQTQSHCIPPKPVSDLEWEKKKKEGNGDKTTAKQHDTRLHSRKPRHWMQKHCRRAEQP